MLAAFSSEFWQISQGPQRKFIHGSANPFSSMGPKIDPDKIGFMDLPGEIRNQIYQLALLTKHNNWIVPYKPCIPHRIPFSLLLTSRQVYEETKDIWYVENVFVEVTTNFLGLPDQFAAMGLPHIAFYDPTRLGTRLQEKMTNPDFRIRLAFTCLQANQHIQYWIPGESLKEFCVALWLLDRGAGHTLSAGFTCLDMHLEFLQKTRAPRSQQSSVLEPFRQLGRVSKARIDGEVDIDLANELVTLLTINQFRSPEEVIERVIVLQDEGDQELNMGNPFGSALRYEQAVAATDYFYHWRPMSSLTVFDSSAGRYAGISISGAIVFEIFRLYKKLTHAFLSMDLVERAERVARKLVSERLRYELRRFGLSNEKVAVGYYILATVLYQKGVRTGLPDCFKHARAELMTCLQLLPRDAVLRTGVEELNCHIYKVYMPKTEEEKSEWEK